MLKIDCLLLNTDYHEGVRKYMKYVAADMMEAGSTPDVESMYKRLRKEGLEVDIESMGIMYMDEFSTREGFTPMDEVEVVIAREFDETARNLLLDDINEDSSPKEKQIGNLSPTKNIARRLVRAFKADEIVDNSTKSTLRKMQDWYADTLGRMTDMEGVKKEPTPDTRTWEEKIQQGLDKMNVGERDIDGTILNLEVLHKDVNRQMKELTDEMRANGKDLEAAQLEKMVSNFQDAVYSIALSQKEARSIVDGILVDQGYAKVNKKGRVDIDWDKFSSETRSLQQIRENAIAAIKKAGHPEGVAERIADNLQREFIEAKKKANESWEKKQETIQKANDKQVRTKSVPSVEDLVRDIAKRFENYKSLSENPDAPLVISKKTVQDLLRHILKEKGLTKEFKSLDKNSTRIDMDKVAATIGDKSDIKQMVRDYLLDNKIVPESSIDAAVKAMDATFGDMMDKLSEYVTGNIENIERTWSPTVKAPGLQRDLKHIINERLQGLENYAKITKDAARKLVFKRSEAKRILSESLKTSEDYGKDGKELNWKELSLRQPSEQELQRIVQDHLEVIEGYEPDVALQIAESIKDVYAEMRGDMKAHAEGMLKAKEAAELRKAPQRNTALNTLAELGALGGFDKAHEKLLNKAIGISDVTTEDLQAIKDISTAYTEAATMTGPQYGDYLQSTMERKINEIVARNQNSRSRLMKVARFMHDWFSLHNFTLISGPFNLIQNITSGAESIIAASREVRNQTGSKSFTDRKIWWNTLKDVAMGGISGDASAKFGTTQAMDKLNTLNFKESPAKALGTSAVILFRAALNGMDAANKAVIRNKAFVVNVHEALVRQGWPKEEATEFIYEMLYGQNRENVRKQAEKIITTYGQQMGIGKSEAAKSRAIERLTDDMVKVNIELGTELGYDMGAKPPVTASTVESAMKAAKHGAGVALGHEANNFFSRGQQAARQSSKRRYDQSIKEGNYGLAAWQSIVNTMVYDGIFRLAVGGANWMVLGLEGTGLRILPAAYSLRKTNKKIWDINDPKAMETAMRERTEYQKQVTRGIIGLSKAAVVLGGMAAIGAAVREDEEEGVMEAASAQIKKSNALAKTFKRTAGAIGLITYLKNVSEGQDESSALASAMEFTTEISNSNPVYSPGGKLVRAQQQDRKGDTEKATGTLGTILGDFAPGIPVLPAYPKLYDLGKEIFTGQQPEYDPAEYPLSFKQGYFYKGLIHRIASQFSEEQLQSVGWENWAKEEK